MPGPGGTGRLLSATMAAMSSISTGSSERGGTALRRALIALCITEITSWGVLYYAFPVMISAVVDDTGWSTAAAMGAFSTGALVAAAAGVVVGRLMDRHGPRPVMTAGSVVAVPAVLAIAAAPNLPAFYAAWALAGIAQSAVLYPPAFTALTGWYQDDRIRAITTLTLVAGFASTVFAPLTAALLDHLDWRSAYLVLAAILGAVTIPLHALCLTPPWHGRGPRTEDGNAARDEELAHSRTVVRSRAFLVLVAVMTVGGFGMYASTINLVPLLVGRGTGIHLAALALGLCGAGQVLGRLLYPPLAARTSPRARTATVLTVGAVAVAVLGLVPGPTAVVLTIAVVAGAARGVHTLLQASAVSDRWGTRAFGRINGVFSAPMTAAIALAPAGGAVVAQVSGGYPAAFALLAVATLAAACAVPAERV